MSLASHHGRADAALGAARARDRSVHLFGHDQSFATSPDEPAVDPQLQLLSRLLARETDRPVILAGTRWAMMHAVRMPQTVEGLVLLDPPVPNVTRWLPRPAADGQAGPAAAGVAAVVARQVARTTPEQLVARQLTDATPTPIRSRRWPSVPPWSGDRLADPVVATARTARSPPPRLRVRSPRLARSGRSGPEKGVGHLPHLEDPEWTAHSINAWLDEQANAR